MARIAIACDDWKAPIFKEILEDAKFEEVEGPQPGLTPDMRLFFVTTNEVKRLARVVGKCQQKAAESKN